MPVARSSLLVCVLLLLLSAPARAAAPSTAVEPPATELLDKREAAFGASLGGLYLPSGVTGPGSASAALLELDWVRGFRGGDLRLGFVGAYEQTYYQSSVNGFAVGRGNLYLGPGFYGIGFGAGLGYGSFSPTGSYHADSGGSAQLVAYVVPALLRFGSRGNVELSFEIGFTDLLAFGGETDPFGALSLGFVTW